MPRGAGKTYYLSRRALFIQRYSDVRCVLVVDPPASFKQFLRDDPRVEFFDSWQAFLDYGRETSTLPRVAVFSLGADYVMYRQLFQFAIAVGNTSVIVDEVHLFAPSTGKGVLIPELKAISTMGRHLQNGVGEDCQVDLLVASQRPTGVHTDIRDNLDTIVVGKFRGKSARNWIRDEHDSEALAEVDALGKHDVLAICGDFPPLTPLPLP